VGAVGSVLHAVNHSVTKAMLFLVAGNILAAYRSKSVHDVQGVLRTLPMSGVLWVAGLFAITGSPPFGCFLSEFTILKAALDQGRGGVAAAYLALLAVVFVGMTTTMLDMAQGSPPTAHAGRHVREFPSSVAPAVALAAVAMVLGLYLPPGLRAAIEDAARVLG